MNSEGLSRKELIRQNDEALLASLGYKQEFKRAFTPLEVWFSRLWPAFSVYHCTKLAGVRNRIFYHWAPAFH